MEVICRLDKSIAKDSPGASLWITFLVASGVTSLSENPVPPVVRITSALFSSLHSVRYFYIPYKYTHNKITILQKKVLRTFIVTIINTSSSCTMAEQETSPWNIFSFESVLLISVFNIGPLSSIFSPLAQVSLTKRS